MFARNAVKLKAPLGARGIAVVPNDLPPVLRRAMLYGKFTPLALVPPYRGRELARQYLRGGQLT